MKKLAVMFALLGCLLTAKPAAAFCVFCDGNWCQTSWIGYHVCVMNLGQCWTQGEPTCLDWWIFSPVGIIRMPEILAEWSGSNPVKNAAMLETIRRCNGTPGCKWFMEGKSGGYGQSWGQLAIHY